MKIKELIRAKDYVTILGASTGFAAIVFMIKDNFTIASLLLIVAAFLDYIDGKIARKVGPTKYGHFLDLSDLSSFGVAPALFIILWLKPAGFFADFEVYAAAILLFIAGLLRLARFFTLDTKTGVPITFNGIVFPLLWFLQARKTTILIVAVAMAFLMTRDFKLPSAPKRRRR